MRSSSSEGSSVVSIQFSLDKDGDSAAQEVRDKVVAAAVYPALLLLSMVVREMVVPSASG